MNVVTIEKRILEKNDEIARQNRALFEKLCVFTINLLSSPGSGKTSLLERVLEELKGRLNVAVIEGDVHTDLDAQRVARYGVPVVQILTHGGCHLEAKLVQDALTHLPLQNTQVLFIENVGNLVCPANYDLGEAKKVVVISTTEGEDKPLKYPAMFRNAHILVINKMDLLPHLTLRLADLKRNALDVNPSLRMFESSCVTGAGIRDLCEWLLEQGSRKP